MVERDHIRNPIEWGADQLKVAGSMIGEASHSLAGSEEARDGALPQVRHIELADLKDALMKGVDDFAAYRSDVIFLCVIYPLVGLLLAWTAFNHRLLPLVFPMITGFALLGPVAAVGLYEISRRREAGVDATWADALGVVRSPALGAITVLGIILPAVFLLWLAAAYKIYLITLGPELTGLGWRIRHGRFHHRSWLGADHPGSWHRLFVRRVGALHQRNLVSDADRPGRRPLSCSRHFGAGSSDESGSNGGLGNDRRRRPRRRVTAATARACHRHACPGARNLASISTAGAALTLREQSPVINAGKSWRCHRKCRLCTGQRR